MGHQLSRRGPDDEQLLLDPHLGLVFRRLSIVDCHGGRQPIANEDGTIAAAINGEIYNHNDLRRILTGEHRFRTQSDCEIVVHLYEERGPEALSALIGMFSIAIWDSARQTLLLARDRLGIKPLYYSRRGGDLLFGSEVKALLAHPSCRREFNWRDWSPEPDRLPTFVKGVDALRAGHYLLWDPRSGVTDRCYWDLSEAFSVPDTGLPAQHYVDRFADLFEDSVSLRLMSDVPIGAFLSGGLDSAALVAVAARQNPALSCFTILEKSTWAAGDAEAAGSVARSAGVPFFPVLFDHAALGSQLGLGLEELEYFVWLMDAPLVTIEFVFKHELHRFAKTVVPDLKVILLGQGIDEFAGGYSNGLNKPHRDWDDYLRSSVTPLWQSERRSEMGIPPSLGALLAPEAYGQAPSAPFAAEMKIRLRTLQMFNLWHEDRTSSGQGVEARVPYLDHRIVELLASVPGRLHAELFWDKTIVRRAAGRWLGAPFVERRKMPFVYGADRTSAVDFMRRWIESAFPAFREIYLTGPHRLFDASSLATLMRVAESDAGRREAAVRLLTACMGICIFAETCRSGPKSFADVWRPPSPLTVCSIVDVPAAWRAGSGIA
jgi:asparagine synthase (glutamine-hydrolysing)